MAALILPSTRPTPLPSVLLKLSLLSLLWLAVGCVGIFDIPRCRVDQDCPAPGRCDPQTARCQQLSTSCTTDADCPSGKVCDPASGGICFDQCSDDSDCSEGDLCDPTKRRCTCTRDVCRRRDGGLLFGCHPILNVCIPHCQSDSDCDTKERCLGPNSDKYCITPADVVDACKEDADCQAPTTRCDQDVVPRKCIYPPKTSCSNDSDCINNKEARRCQIQTSRCVFCLFDEDCYADGQRCLPDGTCRE